MKIGVFDSGLGGRIVLDAIRNVLPQYDYVYYGDTANLPYGDKEEAEIRALTRVAVVRLFQEHECALVVIACNTASSESLRALQEELIVGEYSERRILGVIIPTVETVIEQGARHVLLIGTRRTIESEKYERELTKRSHEVVLTGCATPELVPLIEAGLIDEAYKVITGYLTPRVGEMDTLILGCTHYGLLKELIRRDYRTLTVIAQEEIIPAKLMVYLKVHRDIELVLTRGGTCKYIITGNSDGGRP